jgi:UDP-N-acetylglucosamine:LPS N-acetylglucosamine transferase
MTKVLITATRWGHISIAKAIKEVVEKKYQVELANIEVEPFSKISYHLIYKFAPNLFKYVFLLSEVKFLRNLFNKYVERDYKAKLESEIKKQKPDIVINVYFAFNSSLESLRKKYDFRLINVLADPWTFSRILISKSGENLTFDKYSWRKLKSYEPQAIGSHVGWFTEKKYYEVAKKDRGAIRKRLGLDPNRFTLCIVSGSEGTFNVFKILSTLLNSKYKMQVMILCGNNNSMLKVVKTLKTLSDKIKGPKIIGVPYTESMQYYLKAADLVIGKAGPNTLFETVATLTPFFAISHISGQEDGNLDIIRRYGIGFVEENPRRATKKLKDIIEKPETLSKFKKNLEILSGYCKSSEKKLLNVLAIQK